MKKRQIHPLLSILLALSLMLGLLAAPISAITIDQQGAAPMVLVEENLLSSFKMTITDNNNKAYSNVDGEITVEPENVKAVMMAFEFIKPNSIRVEAGDTYEIDLPDFFAGNASDIAIKVEGVEVATYSITDGKVIITFKAEIENFDDTEIQVNLSGTFDTTVFEDSDEVDVEVPLRDGTTYNVTVKAKQEDYEGVDKKTAGAPYVIVDGQPVVTDKNPTHVDWTVLANDNMDSYDNAKIVDELDPNLELVEDSIKAYRIIRNYKNEEIDREEIKVTSDMVERLPGGGFELKLGSIEDAIEITYTTILKRPDGGGTATINNKARIVLDEKEKEVKDGVTGNWSGDIPVISKTGSATADPHVIDWEIEYNYGKENLGTVTLTDELSRGEIDLATVKVYQVDVDIDGNFIEGSAVEVTIAPGTDADGNVTFPELDADGKAYYITFSSTVPVGYEETVTNTVTDDRPEKNSASDSVPVNTIPTGGKVGEQYVDENGRPYIEWTITVNSNKVDIGSITIRDVFDKTYVDFDETDTGLYELRLVSTEGEQATDKYRYDVVNNFEIDNYSHPEEDDKREGFELVISPAGPNEYKFVYRTYYTAAGMAKPDLANDAELLFFDGSGEGIGDGEPVELPTVSIEGPNAGIEKWGDYEVNTAGDQEIVWTVVFNRSKIMLEEGDTLTEDFTSQNYKYIADSLTLKDDANNTLVKGIDYSLSVDTDEMGFVVTLLKDTNAQLTLTFRTTVDDENNEDHNNEATLKWEGGEETGRDTVEQRKAGSYKNGEVLINEDGSKSIKWTVGFNTNKHVIHDFELVDTYTPNTVTVSNIKITDDKGADVTSEFVNIGETTGGTFTITKKRLDAKAYTLTYLTTLSAAEEQEEIKNTAAITYTGGFEKQDKPISNPNLLVEKQANGIDKSGDDKLISWTIQVNTDAANKHVNLVNAILEDTIPTDQKLLSDTIEIARTDGADVTLDLVEANDNYFKIALPDGPYQYVVDFKTEILRMPSVDPYVFDRYNNSTKLTNQPGVEGLEQSDTAAANIRYYEGTTNNLTGKTGAQDEDTENIDYVLTINPEALTIHNAKIKDTLYSDERDKFHQYIDDSIKLFDENDDEVTEGYSLEVAADKHSFEISFVTEANPTGTINSKYTIRYSTRLRSDLVGSYQVVNNIVLTGGTDGTELHKTTTTTSAQQWFYGGGGSGRTVRLEINKFNNQVADPGPGPIENAMFKLERANLDGTYTTVDAEIGTDSNGIIVKDVLRAGRYKLTELSTPNLYRKLSQPVYFLIGYTHPDDYIKDENGDVIKDDQGNVLNPYTIQITNPNWQAASHSHAETESDVLTITNDYKPVLVSFEAEKDLRGQELWNNQFSFALFDSTGKEVTEAKNNAAGKVSFAAQSFGNTGTYTYTIRELNTEQGGMEYDETEFTVTVVVSEGTNGLVAEVTYTNPAGDAVLLPEFNNVYTANGNWAPIVTKDLDAGGRDLKENEFNFKLMPVEGAPMPTGATELLASNDADGKVVFATIPYTEADIGKTYYYEIVEVAGEEIGMSYDPMTVKYKVVITDAGNGVLNVVHTVEGEGADFEFNNTYNASGMWTPEVSKKLAAGGRRLLADEFNFKLTPLDGATMPGNADELHASNDADGKVVFETIPYTQEDINQTYYYKVVEVPGDEIGMTYDPMTVTYKVVITDAGNGVLDVEVTVEGEAEDTEFNNTYVASGSYTAEVGKELSGRELFDEEFNFRLIPVDGATMPVGEDDEPVGELTAVNIDGKVVFDTIPYTEADIGQTYTYLITELSGTEGSITYDPLVITLEVAITDGRNGVLIVDAQYVPAEGSEEADTVFNNEYHADGSWTPTVSKQLLAGGRELQEDEFVFELYQLEADGETWTLLQTASNAADGGVVFEPVSYSELDVGQEYSYKIVERAGTEAGMSYSDLEVTIQVAVTDPELLGELEVTTEYSEDRLFINTYEAEGSFAPELTKDLVGRDLAADEFSFTLVPVDGAPLPLDESNEPLSELTATNAADGKIVFADIAYTEADIGQTYTYLITELAGELGGVAYSDQEIVLTVSISDAGNGELAISTLYTDDATFTNTYTVDPIEVVLEAEKQLKGQDLKAGQFEFELLDENGEVLETVKNAADGKVAFSAIEYNGAGEYNYVIREVKGSEPGYIYDESEYRVLVSVTDHGDGTITADVDLQDGDVVFVNAYEALAATGESRSILQSLGVVLVALGAALLIQRRRRNRKIANS